MTVMTRRRSLALAIVAVLVGTTALAWVVTREQIASGSGKNGDWRVVASWNFGYCLKRHERNGEGGACGLAQPGTLNESLSWRVFQGDEAYTLVAGPVPPGATSVEVTPTQGDAAGATLTKVLSMTFYVADFPGVQAMKGIQALDDQGHVVEELEHGPLPPPGP